MQFTKLSLAAPFGLALVFTATSVQAGSATWNGTTDSLWDTTTNWSASPVPGGGDTATFNNAGTGNTTITVGNISLLSLLFDTANAAAYTLDSGSISLGSAGNFTVNSTVTTMQTVNTVLALNGGYTFTNHSTAGGQSLSIGGGISSATAGTKTLTVNGAGEASRPRPGIGVELPLWRFFQVLPPPPRSGLSRAQARLFPYGGTRLRRLNR